MVTGLQLNGNNVRWENEMDRIDPERVDEIFRGCLFTDEELEVTGGKCPKGAVLVEGVVGKFGFHPGRLEGHTDEIGQMLDLLGDRPKEGCSFLELCNQGDGHQWTGLHIRMNQLVCLGIGTKQAELLILPGFLKEMMPGGMPYVRALKVGQSVDR